MPFLLNQSGLYDIIHYVNIVPNDSQYHESLEIIVLFK